MPEGIVANHADKGDRQAEAGGLYRHVGTLAAEGLTKIPPEHGLADRGDTRRGHHQGFGIASEDDNRHDSSRVFNDAGFPVWPVLSVLCC